MLPGLTSRRRGRLSLTMLLTWDTPLSRLRLEKLWTRFPGRFATCTYKYPGCQHWQKYDSIERYFQAEFPFTLARHNLQMA